MTMRGQQRINRSGSINCGSGKGFLFTQRPGTKSSDPNASRILPFSGQGCSSPSSSSLMPNGVEANISPALLTDPGFVSPRWADEFE